MTAEKSTASDQARAPCVFVTDDDDSVREAIAFLLDSEQLDYMLCASADKLLGAVTPDHRGCILLDVRMPGLDGLQAQQALNERGIRLPVIFISGHADVNTAVRAVQAGALDFVEKPFNDELLVEKIRNATELDREEWENEIERDEIERRIVSLTPRERQVVEGILEGKLNKIIADDLDISVRTVEIHRANALEKIGARNSSEMIRMVLSSYSYRNWLL
ncbi:response regulator transcription factor [Wenzhouxiangella sp. EGI_FJ10305]|uniref:response regulator transcription factor n=1 Tax=Wenzhouxiangella sp. EGI_FJ10305 TaxID=3243768 RepID=UPI0035E00020